jgi:hypothetical protein
VTSAKIAEKGVATGNLADESVTGGKIAKETITAEKLAKGVLGNVETLKAGQTERGMFSVGGYAPKEATESPDAYGSVSFQLPLAANPSTVLVIPKGTTQAPYCPGLGGGGTTPEALGNVVCLYLTTETNLEGVGAAAVTTEGNRLGVNLTVKGKKGLATASNFVASGVWAVTAP